MITGIYEFGVFWSRNGRFVTHMLFPKKKVAETPIFIVFLACAFFGPSGQKREILETHPKKKTISLITEKLIFEYFLFFLVFFFFFFLFFFFFFFCCVLLWFFWRV